MILTDFSAETRAEHGPGELYRSYAEAFESHFSRPSAESLQADFESRQRLVGPVSADIQIRLFRDLVVF